MTKQILKKYASLYLLLFAVTGIFCITCSMPVYAIENKGTYGDFDYAYQQISQEITITKYKGQKASVSVPGQIDGYPVTQIGIRAFANCKSLQKITLPDTITGISDYAFSGCGMLKSLKLPESTVKLGTRIIENTAIPSMAIPKSISRVTQYGFAGPFANCQTLTKVEFAAGTESIPAYMLSSGNYASNVNTVTIPNSVTQIGNCAFYNCKKLAIRSLAKVEKIGNSAFAGCQSITEMSFPKTLETLGNNAFGNCGELLTVKFATNTEKAISLTIGSSAFSKCLSLKNVTLSESITAINDYAFSGCGVLKSLTLPESLERLGTRIIENTAITKITVPKNVSRASQNALAGPFANCEKLKKVTFEEGMEQIPSYILDCGNYKSKIKSVVIPASVTKIGSHAFHNCSSLSITKLPDVAVIDTYAFSGCKKIERMAFPKTLTLLGNGAFYGCDSLKKVSFTPETNKAITLRISASAFEDCTSLKTVAFSENVSAIGSYAFSGCGVLKKLELPDSLTTMGLRMIESTAIKSIVIPANVTKCESASNTGPLANCTSLQTVEIASGMERIPNNMFAFGNYKCNLESVTIPMTVTAVSPNAFYNCGSIVIYGYANSYAQTFAKEKNYSFSVLKERKNKTKKELAAEVDAKAAEAASELKSLNKNGIISWNQNLKNYFTNKQLTLIADAILSVASLTEVPESSFNDKIAESFMDECLGEWKIDLWSGNTVVPVTVTANSKIYGKLKVEFSCLVSNYALEKSIFGQLGKINYKIIGGAGMKKIDAKYRSGFAGMMANPKVGAFSDAACSLAVSEIKKAYKDVWGDDADKVAEILFDDTISDILKAVDQETFSDMVFDFLVEAVKK